MLTVPLEPGYSTTEHRGRNSETRSRKYVTHPAIRDLFQSLSRTAAFQDVAGQLTRNPNARISLSGLTNTAKALYLVLLWQATERQFLVIVDGNKQAETLAELIETFFDLLVTSDIPRPQTDPGAGRLARAETVASLPKSASSAPSGCGGWRADAFPSRSLRLPRRCCAPRARDFYRQLALTLRVGEEIPLEDLIAHLESIGYEKREPVEMTGEYSLRGGILDVFPAEASKPVRMELFGDLIESIRRFDVETQRSVLKIAETTLLPLVEYPEVARRCCGEIAEQMDVPEPRRSVSRLGVSGAAGAAARALAAFAD